MAYSPQYNPQTTQFIGGIAIGTAGAVGTIYEGYTLVGGDDFTGPLDIMHIGNPYGRYSPTRMVGTSTPAVGTRLDGAGHGYYMDPYHTGAQDSNRGVPIGSTNLSQTNSCLVLQSRIPNGTAETNGINGRSILDATIYCGADTTYVPPCIYEHYSHFNQTIPRGAHCTGWIQQVMPFALGSTSPGWQEYDFPEVNTGVNYNAWGMCSGLINGAGNSSGTFTPGADGFKLYSYVMTAANAKMYLDLSLVRTIAQDTTNSNKPYQPIFSNATDSNFVLGDWTTLGASGLTNYTDYYRIWLPTAQASQILNPTQKLPNAQVAFNTPFTYTFPSATALWGSAITDYIQAAMLEDFEPGGGNTGVTSYYNFPSELTLTGRVLSGSITSRPGRMHLFSVPYVAGGSLGKTARGYVDIGPHITTTTINAVVGASGSHDLYFECDCGDLVAKTITVSGLPSGFSFDGVSTISWTAGTTAGTTSITIGVTNVVGQTASISVNTVVAAAGVIVLDSSSFSSSTTFNAGTQIGTATITTSAANELIYMVVRMGGAGAASVTGITDTAGLSWAKRSTGTGTNTTNNYETWYAVAASQVTSNVISVATTGATSVRMLTMGIQNVNTTTPFDTNGTVPTSVYNAAANTLTRTISTNHGNDMVIAYCSTSLGGVTYTDPSGFTNIPIAGTTANDLCYQVQSTTLSSKSVTYSVSSGSTMNVLVDAIQGV